MHRIFKIIVVGDAGVGKSSLRDRFMDNLFQENYRVTIAIDLSVKVITVHDKKIKLQIWDTAGHEAYKALTKIYYKGTSGVIICFDMTNRQSFDNVSYWIDEVQNICSGPQMILVGTKADLLSENPLEFDNKMNYIIPLEDINNLIDEYRIPYFLCLSSKNDNGKLVDKCFYKLAELILKADTHEEVEQVKDEPVNTCGCVIL